MPFRRSPSVSAPGFRLTLGLVTLVAAACGCNVLRRPPEVAGTPPAEPTPAPAPEASKLSEEEGLVVKKVPEPIVVAAWAEPKRLPPGGGQAQLLVRVQKRGGVAYPGVEVRFKSTEGNLYSQGKVLVTNEQGLTRDRLTTKKRATVTLNAGGTRYTFTVPVGDEPSS
jgi:hypothetical protein